MEHRTMQEQFWAGSFGNDYVERSRDPRWIASNLAFFARVLGRTTGVTTALELGANIGLNLHALRQLLPGAALSGVEINEKAAGELRSLGWVEVFHESILDFSPERQWDLVFTKGVLIHISPDALPDVYATLHDVSARYILVSEYYNPSPVAIPYRGTTDTLFKRDFAGEMLDRWDDLELIDYGFVYHRDSNFRQDDTTWFLLERRGPGRRG